MKIRIQKKVTIVLFLISLFFNFDGKTSISKDETCQEIKRNYIDAVNQFLSALRALKREKQFSPATPLNAAINTLHAKKDYRFPTLKILYDAIHNAAPKEAHDEVKKLKAQKDSAHTRVKQWKEKTKERPTPCREQWECDLGQPGTKCAVNVN